MKSHGSQRQKSPITPGMEHNTILPEFNDDSPRLKASKFIARLGMAALCIIPPADLALSDAAFVKSYDVIQDHIETSSKPLERGLEAGAMAGLITAQSIALGQVLTRSKKLDGTFKDFDNYRELRQSQMGTVRKAISTAANSPLTALEKVGNLFEKAGNRISERKSKIARAAGSLLVETGQVNAMGTSSVIMEETMAGNPPSLKRQAYLGGLIAGSWVGGAEIVRTAYRNISAIRPPLAAIGRTFETLTSVDLNNPARSPIATLAVSSVAAGLAYTGWKIEEFRQQREELTAIKHQDLQNPLV